MEALERRAQWRCAISTEQRRTRTLLPGLRFLLDGPLGVGPLGPLGRQGRPRLRRGVVWLLSSEPVVEPALDVAGGGLEVGSRYDASLDVRDGRVRGQEAAYEVLEVRRASIEEARDVLGAPGRPRRKACGRDLGSKRLQFSVSPFEALRISSVSQRCPIVLLEGGSPELTVRVGTEVLISLHGLVG